MNPMKMFRKKFEEYRRITETDGLKKAHNVLMEGYAERQKQNLGR